MHGVNLFMAETVYELRFYHVVKQLSNLIFACMKCLLSCVIAYYVITRAAPRDKPQNLLERTFYYQMIPTKL